MDYLTANIHQDYSYYAFGKWFYYPERVDCVRRGNFRDVMPVTVQLAPSLHCNFCCPRCSYGRAKENIQSLGGPRSMQADEATMAVIIDRLSAAGIKGVVFTGGGEPTMYPHLIDSIQYAVQRGLKVGLFTNGSLLTDTRIEKLLGLEPTFIRVSLDAGSPDIHRLLHGYSNKHDCFLKVLENINILAKTKLRKKVNTTIGIGVSVEPINLGDLVEVAKQLREIMERPPHGGIDYLVFRPTVNYQGGKSLQTAQPMLDYLKEKIPGYYQDYYDFMYSGKQFPARLFEEANRVISDEIFPLLKYTGIRTINIRTKMLGVTQSDHPFRKCRASPWYIFIGPDGTVYNCIELGLDPRVAIGNLLTQSLKEIWGSQRRQDVLDFIDSVGLNTLCPPVCVYYELNHLFEKLDEAIGIGGSWQHEALNWIDRQEAHVRAEVTSGKYSQPHREFM